MANSLMNKEQRFSKGRLVNLTTGFTLPELLVAGIIAAAIAGITAQVMIGQLLEGRRLEAAQRVRENFSRLNYLVQVEASEADEIEVGVQPPGCATNEGFTLWVPKPDGEYNDPDNRSGIQYFNANGDIARCGPGVTRNGVLIHAVASDGSTHATGIVVPNAQLDLNCAATSPGREVSYSVNFAGGNFGSAGAARCVVAHARSVYVCNPSVGSGGCE